MCTSSELALYLVGSTHWINQSINNIMNSHVMLRKWYWHHSKNNTTSHSYT
jgi:hypothetical protein